MKEPTHGWVGHLEASETTPWWSKWTFTKDYISSQLTHPTMGGFLLSPQRGKPMSFDETSGDKPMNSPLKQQVVGEHYVDMAIQPVEYIHKNQLGFIEGAVVKYVSRHKRKNGAEDIRKAIHFLELLLELEYGES